MTTLKRTAIILVAALVVVGVLWGLAQWGGLNLLAGEGRGRFRELGGENFRPAGQDQFAAGQPGNFPPRDFEGGDRGRAGGGWSGLGEVFKNLVIVGVIVAGVAGGSTLLHRLRRGRPRTPAASV